MTDQEREALAKAVKEAWNGVARHIYHAQTHEYELPDHPALAAREEARGSCTCRHPPEGMIGWDRGMVDRECPVHGHEALPERRDPQMEKVIEAVQGARGQSNATRVMMSLDLLLEGAEEAIDDGGMLDPVSVKAIVLRGLTAAREDTERPGDALRTACREQREAGERAYQRDLEPDGAGTGCEKWTWTGVAPDGENECEACYVEPEDTDRPDTAREEMLDRLERGGDIDA